MKERTIGQTIQGSLSMHQAGHWLRHHQIFPILWILLEIAAQSGVRVDSMSQEKQSLSRKQNPQHALTRTTPTTKRAVKH
jgi:hypothetical protein